MRSLTEYLKALKPCLCPCRELIVRLVRHVGKACEKASNTSL